MIMAQLIMVQDAVEAPRCNTNLTGPLTQIFIDAGLDPTTAAAQASGLFSLIVLNQTNPNALTPGQIATLNAPRTQSAIHQAREMSGCGSAVPEPTTYGMFAVLFLAILAWKRFRK
jgi:hypothetical protein